MGVGVRQSALLKSPLATSVIFSIGNEEAEAASKLIKGCAGSGGENGAVGSKTGS